MVISNNYREFWGICQKDCCLKKAVIAVIFLGLLGLGVSGLLYQLRSPRTALSEDLFPGIHYTRSIQNTPYLRVIHQVTVDVTSPHIQWLVTPGNPSEDGTEISARTTSEFVREFDVQLGINGSFFYPFYVKSPWDYFPKVGDRVQVLGQAISDGIEYSPGNPGWFVFCILENRTALIPGDAFCPEHTQQGLAGGAILVWQGEPVPLMSSEFYDGLSPRTAIGINRERTQLFILVVDGRQPFYSEGISLPELQEVLIKLGVETALNLDGGGSTTLVVADPKVRVLNAPIHTRIPLRERPVANHFGLRWQVINNEK